MSFDTVLAAGDVDELRRLLRAAATTSEEPAPSHAELASDCGRPNMYVGAEHIVLTLSRRCPPVQLVSTRVMGKVVWPAGHAVALYLCEHFVDLVAAQSEADTASELFAPVATPSIDRKSVV